MTTSRTRLITAICGLDFGLLVVVVAVLEFLAGGSTRSAAIGVPLLLVGALAAAWGVLAIRAWAMRRRRAEEDVRARGR